MRTIAIYHRRRSGLAVLGAAVVTAGALLLAGAGAASASTGSSPGVTPYVPYEYTYQIVAPRGFWWLPTATGKVDTFTGEYIPVKPTSGTNQEFQDLNTKNCLTYASANYIYEKGCGNAVSQQWRTTQLSNGLWLIKNNYLGTGYCATYPGYGEPIVLNVCVSGDANQEWGFTILN